MAESTKVLIVGAGPVGLTLAVDLAKRGIPFRIIDILAEPNRNSRAHGVQSRTLECLDILALAQPILDEAQSPQPCMTIRRGSRTVARLDFAGACHTPFPYELLIWQQNIEKTLRETLTSLGHEIEWNSKLARLSQHPGQVSATIERGSAKERIMAEWLVGCDGEKSMVRREADLQMQGAAMPHSFLLGEFDIAWGESTDTVLQWWHPNGITVAVYIDLTQKWHVIIESRKAEDTQPTLDRFQSLFTERTEDPSATLSKPVWMNHATFDAAMSDRFIVGRVLLAGDSAHVHSSAGGQGLNTGVQDALNLGWKLALAANGTAAPSLLQTYDEERVDNARRVLAETIRYHRFVLPSSPLAMFFTGLYFRALGRNRTIGDAARRKVGMLNIGYRGGPLSGMTTENRKTRVRAGDFLPDASCRIMRKPGHLRDILRGTRATLLMYTGINPDAHTLAAMCGIEQSLAPLNASVSARYVFSSETDLASAQPAGEGIVLDGCGYIRSALGFTGPELVFVRPDGYIGLRTPDITQRTLFDYLHWIYADAVFALRQAQDQSNGNAYLA